MHNPGAIRAARWRSRVVSDVIARSKATKQSSSQSAALWIASLALAMTIKAVAV
jgi:hypothetical protein